VHAGRFVPFIAGRSIDDPALVTLEVPDPSTGAVFAEVALGEAEHANAAVRAARAAFVAPSWRDLGLSDRSQALHGVAEVLDRHCDELADLDVHTAALSPTSARWGIRAAAAQFRYYAGLVDKLEGATIPVGPHVLNYSVWEPLGVTVHILPSNSPIYLFGRSVAAALAAGNTAVVKPAEQTTPSAVRFVQLLADAHVLPDGVLNVVPGTGSVVGEALLRHPEVAEITFTGSVPVGRHVMQRAAERVCPVVLELGGKAPNIVFGDADLERAIPAAVRGAFDRAGQVCVARSRLLVHERLHDEVIARVSAASGRLRIGRAVDEPEVGPLITRALAARVADFVEIGRKEGAELVQGGSVPDDARLAGGFFYRPTVFAGVRPEMRIAREEIFGPVLSVLTFADDDEAIALANAVPYGLYAEVWTNDLRRAHRVAARIESGRVGINGDVVAPQVPSGGFKESGIGIEKGLLGIRNYLRLKTVSVMLD